MSFEVWEDVSDTHIKLSPNDDGFIDRDMVTMFEEAYKKQPTNEDLGAQTFFANVRASNWKSAHQVSILSVPDSFDG